jgi:transposase InsO family protein
VQTAIAVRGGPVAGVVLHTDQGGEFTGGELTRVCARAGITQSMGRTGSALDNAVSESFHSTLEFELLSRNRFATHDHPRPAVVAWLDEYNTRPAPFDQRHAPSGRVRAWPAPSRREELRPAPSPAPSSGAGNGHDQDPGADGYAAAPSH